MCKATEHLIFCSCEPHELPEKLKAANFDNALISGLDETAVYHWRLTRKAKEKIFSGAKIMGSIVMPEPRVDEILDQDDILSVLNTKGNCFDFNYEAQSGDCIKVFSNNYDAYMSFIFDTPEEGWKPGYRGINENEELQSGSLLLH